MTEHSAPVQAAQQMQRLRCRAAATLATASAPVAPGSPSLLPEGLQAQDALRRQRSGDGEPGLLTDQCTALDMGALTLGEHDDADPMRALRQAMALGPAGAYVPAGSSSGRGSWGTAAVGRATSGGRGQPGQAALAQAFRAALRGVEQRHQRERAQLQQVLCAGASITILIICPGVRWGLGQRRSAIVQPVCHKYSCRYGQCAMPLFTGRCACGRPMRPAWQSRRMRTGGSLQRCAPSTPTS